MKTPKLFGVILLSLRRAIEHRFKHAKWGIVNCASLQSYTGILFLDLTKAFDTVCYQILLAKLQHYGIRGPRGPSHQLIKSFLERKQYVSINGVNSDLQHHNFGEPQGSTLGSLLFLIYINDLPNAVLGSTTLFADDTCLMLRNSNLLTLQNDLNSK